MIQRIQSFPMVKKFESLEDVEKYLEDLRRAMTEDQYLRNFDIDVDTTGSDHWTFKTITGITNDVVADQMADTLNLASGNTALTIAGTALTDTITWTWAKLGIESLTDPNADRIFFWDDGEGASKWLAPNVALEISTTSLNVKYDNSTIKVDGSNQLYAALTGLTHEILSATHSDSIASTVAKGDIITGQGAPAKWDNLAIGTVGKFLYTDGTDVSWLKPDHGSIDGLGDDDHTQYSLYSFVTLVPTAGANVVADARADTLTFKSADGSVVITGTAASDEIDFSAPGGAAHAILSTTHNDSLAAAVARGSLIYGNATPKWAALAIGTTGYYLKSDGTDAAWAVLPLGFGSLVDPGLDQVVFWDDSESALKWSGCVVGLSAGTGIALAAGGTGMVAYTVSSKDSEIDHDALKNFAAAEHYDWTNETHDILTTGAISLGTSPSATGRIRIPNNDVIKARNAAGAADLNVIYADKSNRIIVGSANSIICHTSGNMGVGSTSTDIEMVSVYGRLALVETTAPALTAGWGKLYVKSSDSLLYFLSDLGNEYKLTSSKAGANYDLDDYPASPNALDDEFADASINVKWTKVNEPGAPNAFDESTYSGYIWVGLPELVTDSYDSYVQLYQTAPAGAAVAEYIAKVAVGVDAQGSTFIGQYGNVTLCLINSTDKEWIGVSNQINSTSASGGRVYGCMNSGTAFTNMTSNYPEDMDLSQYVYIKLKKTTNAAYTSANTYEAHYSFNGMVWVFLGTASKTFTHACDRFGFLFRLPAAQTGTPIAYAVIDWVRRTV